MLNTPKEEYDEEIKHLAELKKSGVKFDNDFWELKTKDYEKLKESKLPSIHIFQPSLLLGERKEFRLGERIGAAVLKGFNLFLSGRLSKYRAIKARDVAKAMIQVALNYTPGFHIYTSDQIKKIADATIERK